MIMNVFLDGVAMMIAICLVVVTCVFVFWGMARIVRWVWRPEHFGPYVLVPLMVIFNEMLRMLGLFSPPDTPIATWCQGCDELVSPARMAFTDGWRYRCEDCRRPRRQFVMDLSSVDDAKAGREVLAVHDAGQVHVMQYPPVSVVQYESSPATVRGGFQRRYRLPDTAAEYMEEQRRRAHEAAERRRDDAMRAAVMQEAQKIRRWVDSGTDDRR